MIESSSRPRSSAFIPVAPTLFSAQNFFLPPSASHLLPTGMMYAERLATPQNMQGRQCNLFPDTSFETTGINNQKPFEQGQLVTTAKSASSARKNLKPKRSTSFNDSDFDDNDDSNQSNNNNSKGCKRKTGSQSPGE
jgi:hypothetical protein